MKKSRGSIVKRWWPLELFFQFLKGTQFSTTFGGDHTCLSLPRCSSESGKVYFLRYSTFVLVIASHLILKSTSLHALQQLFLFPVSTTIHQVPIEMDY